MLDHCHTDCVHYRAAPGGTPCPQGKAALLFPLSPSSLVPPHICLLPLPVPRCLYTTETPCCCSAVFLSIPPVLLCPHRPTQCCRLLPVPHIDSFVQITGYFSWILPSNMFAVKLNDLNLLHSILSPTSGQC